MAATAGAARRAAFGALAATWDAAKPREAIEAGVARGLDLLGDVRGLRAIDLGAGPGRLEPFLLPRLGGGHAVAVDFAPEMVVRGAMEVRDPRVTWLCRDVLETGLPDACADLVLCFNAWAHFPDGPGVLREVRRWLKPGGRILLWHDLGRERLAEVHRRAGHAVSSDLLPPVEALAFAARNAGFAVERAEEDDRSWTLLACSVG
ncbi:MAG: class I SAM-dependent methyltransferase [Thermoanaerobaculia bacterium]|jgi:SAM-dependent methyltransferase|nr:class I SAM-dependent methyltransferase [Thermoanaerobaculia bacterium]